jgi:hypothetical protein
MRSVDAALFSEQSSQPLGGVPITGVGADSQVFGVNFAGEVVLEECVAELPSSFGLSICLKDTRRKISQRLDMTCNAYPPKHSCSSTCGSRFSCTESVYARHAAIAANPNQFNVPAPHRLTQKFRVTKGAASWSASPKWANP